MIEPPVWLTPEQGAAIVTQFRETAQHRGWALLAIAVMPNHVHLLVEAPDALGAGRLLADFKAYASRRLDRDFREGAKRRWWTERGSTRVMKNPEAVATALEYVRNQYAPLVVWIAECDEKGNQPAD